MKELRIKIALAVDERGYWHAYGGNNITDDEALQEAIGNIHDGVVSSAFFVETIVPVPQAQIIEGTIEQTNHLDAARKNFEYQAEELVRMRKMYEKLIIERSK